MAVDWKVCPHCIRGSGVYYRSHIGWFVRKIRYTKEDCAGCNGRGVVPVNVPERKR